MRKFLIALCSAGALLGLGAAAASAAPVTGTAVNKALKADSMVQQARLYCYNRYTGEFLHWGPCAHDVWRFRHHHRHYW